MIRVLIVEDESYVAESLVALLSRRGFDPSAVASAEAALEQPVPDIVVTDLRLPGWSGVELLRELKEREPSLPVILLTGQGTVADAVEAMRAGADDFLTKPVDPDVIVERIRKAAERRSVERERDRWRGNEKIVGESPAMQLMLRQIEALAQQDVSVLILGESGTGKELLATHLHEKSTRRAGPFVRVHCGAVPAGLVESEFFGHIRGAFSGATEDRRGWFAEADGGTLFLDEIGTLPLSSQAKLLRVLETGEMRPVGSDVARHVNVRVVAATNENLEAMRDAGEFRSDLYFRLAGAPLTVPPLRNRPDDLATLAARFALPAKINPAAMKLLRRYRWPGNVRELRNVIARARVEADGSVLDAADFEPLLPVASGNIHLKTRVQVFERDLFTEALRRADGRKSDAAKLLGIDPSNWAYHAKRLDLQSRPPRP